MISLLSVQQIIVKRKLFYLRHHIATQFHWARSLSAALWCHSAWSWCLDGRVTSGNTSHSAPARFCWSLSGLLSTPPPSFLIWKKWPKSVHIPKWYKLNPNNSKQLSSDQSERNKPITFSALWGQTQLGSSWGRQWCHVPCLHISSGWLCGEWPLRSHP